MVLPGAHSSVRTSSANAPPTISEPRMPNRYIIPIRLWSSVSIQLLIPLLTCRKSGSVVGPSGYPYSFFTWGVAVVVAMGPLRYFSDLM
jgi:hypothetical protein